MNLLVFVTDDGKGGSTAPTLFMRERPDAALPPHPRSLEWRYFATISDKDEMFRAHIGSAVGLELEEHYMVDRLIHAAPA